MCDYLNNMGEQVEDQISDVDMNNSELAFDNLTILKEFSNIASLVKYVFINFIL